jgi:NAD(P)-dependent dehydrogenase (short-subunit alcohol dehydrogenase family)
MSADGRPVALVTGAAAGIGRAVALRLAAGGHDVVAADRDLAGAEETAALVGEAGGTGVAVPCDVLSGEQIADAVAVAEDRFGRLDLAVNNAGLGTPATSIEELREEDWDLVLGIDLKGVWLSMKHELPLLRASGGGAIVNMSSMWGVVGFTEISPAYVAAKHGVVGLTRCAALQYAEQGIRVNAVCPGTIRTPGLVAKTAEKGVDLQHFADWSPMRRLGTPEEIADAVAWLGSDASAYVTGIALSVDGGYTAG